MPKIPVVLVTFFRRGPSRAKLGRTFAFNALNGIPVFEFYRHNSRPYQSASAAVRNSEAYEEMAGFFGVQWLRDWEVRSELEHYHRVHGTAVAS